MLVTADRIYLGGRMVGGHGISIDEDGRITAVAPLGAVAPDTNLGRRLLVPGMVNAHSHAFQRLLRGRTQVADGGGDNFWTWRKAMYHVAQRLDPDSLYLTARLLFAEFLLAGVTTVGEFHYLHHDPDGRPYEQPGAMALALARAADDVGIRLSVLRTIYLRGDFDEPTPSPLQQRFSDPGFELAWQRLSDTIGSLRDLNLPTISWGVAAHSVRAVHIDDILALKTAAAHLPFHMHASEQPREVQNCLSVYGDTPVMALARRNILDAQTTLVHVTHPRYGDLAAIAQRGASVCMCPSTEADLGDGLGPAADMVRADINVALGTDGQTNSSILAEASRLEMHERLREQGRNRLLRQGSSAAAAFEAATRGGARALGLTVGDFTVGSGADLAVYDLDDPGLAGLDDDALLAGLVFSADSRALTDVMVAGRWRVRNRELVGLGGWSREYAAMTAKMFAT